METVAKGGFSFVISSAIFNLAATRGHERTSPMTCVIVNRARLYLPPGRSLRT